MNISDQLHSRLFLGFVLIFTSEEKTLSNRQVDENRRSVRIATLTTHTHTCAQISPRNKLAVLLQSDILQWNTGATLNLQDFILQIIQKNVLVNAKENSLSSSFLEVQFHPSMGNNVQIHVSKVRVETPLQS